MKISERKAALAKLLEELKAGEAKMSDGTLTQPEAEALEAKAKEAIEHQTEIDRHERIKTLVEAGKEPEEPVLPATKGTPQTKARGPELGEDGSPVIGYKSVGQLFVDSPEFKNYLERGMPLQQGSMPMGFKTIEELYVPITQKMVESKTYEGKAVPTIGAGVLAPDRIALVARAQQYDRLRVRDVLNISQTGQASVEYLVEDAVVEVAAPVAESAAKPEATMALSLATSPVRTLAVWMPVTEQQLQDVPQIRNIIDNRLRYDLKKLEEKQFMYGSGAGQNLQGILTLAGVPLITRTVTNTQNLDRIRIGITDVLVAGYEPNALTIHPLDWEAIVLLKATDNKYIWVVVTDPETGNSRVWGLQVVETVAMKNPASTQRYMLVGDFRRGATVWDRQQANVQVGFINDQFIKNQRTIRVEERLAFGVTAPLAFAKYETAAAA